MLCDALSEATVMSDDSELTDISIDVSSILSSNTGHRMLLILSLLYDGRLGHTRHRKKTKMARMCYDEPHPTTSCQSNYPMYKHRVQQRQKDQSHIGRKDRIDAIYTKYTHLY